jgi:hypothetical protein
MTKTFLLSKALDKMGRQEYQADRSVGSGFYWPCKTSFRQLMGFPFAKAANGQSASIITSEITAA